MTLKIVFQNIYQGLHFAGKKDKLNTYYKYWPSTYIDFFEQYKPDILCMLEVPCQSQEGESAIVEKASEKLKLPYFNSVTNGESWLVEDTYYANSILSKYPFEEYTEFKIPRPHLEVDHPDGSHWIMHHKRSHFGVFDINGKKIKIFNMHCHPFFHFQKKIDDPDILPFVQKLETEVIKESKDSACIITADLNNKFVNAADVFPKFFDGNFQNSISFSEEDFETNYEGEDTQMDHVLYQPEKLNLIKAEIFHNYSDHNGIFAEFEIK